MKRYVHINKLELNEYNFVLLILLSLKLIVPAATLENGAQIQNY